MRLSSDMLVLRQLLARCASNCVSQNSSCQERTVVGPFVLSTLASARPAILRQGKFAHVRAYLPGRSTFR